MFLVYGIYCLCLLNFKIVVEVILMYELIISWVMLNKYIVILCGFFELKYFFMFVILFLNGGFVYFVEVVCYWIKELIDKEELNRVFFDDWIVEILNELGIEIVRCIVVKYWEVFWILFFI